MRRFGKRILAITMAAAMMTSLTPQGCTFLQQQIVYAAEQGEENLQPIYVQTETVTSDQKDLKDDNWEDDKPIIPITESVANTEITSNFDMTADITIDETGYQNLAAEGSYLKLQGVVKTGEKWDWVDSQTIPYLEQKNFEKTGDRYTTSITIPFKDKTAAELKGVYFVVVGNGFHGVITFSNTKLTPIEVATSKEVLAYACEKNGKAEIDFSDLTAENWVTLPTIELEKDIAGANIGANAIYRGKITIDQDTYASLDKEGSYIKLQTVMKIGKEDDWTQGGSYPYLDKNAFTANGDGTYSATFEDKYSDITEGNLLTLIVRAVGIGAKGSITISDVNIYNVISADAPLPEKEATVVDDFESAEIGSAAGWENEAGWQYDKEVTATVQEQNSSKMLKLDLDYTGCEGYTWSEAKIKKSFEEGLDVSAYNQLTYDMIYPAEFDGKFKVKVFAKEADSNTEIINKEAVIETTDLGDGMKKASVTIKFSPNTAKITDLTLGTVGVSTAFKGAVYIDNVKLSQYDAGADFVEITSTPDNENATKADISAMKTTVSLADTNATKEALALYSYLQNLDAEDQVLFGHQNDTHKSVSKTAPSGSDTKDVTGSISGVVGIDSLALTGVELGMTDTNAAVQESIRIGKEAAKEGGILTLSMHMPNMSNEKIVETESGYDFSACDFAESKDLSNNCAKEVLPGGKYNEQFKAYLNIIAEYAKGLVDENGDSIPVLFRPFHECDGGWFWWGNASTDDETYKAMFRYMEDYLNEQGVNNFIYVYSPGGPVDSDTYLDRYPGDDYVDVLAFDYYDDYSSATASYSEDFINKLTESCTTLKSIADAHGKVAAIAEAGVRIMKADGSDQEGILVKNNPIKGQNWYSKVNNVAKETGMSYFLLWANFSDTNFYIPYKYNETKGQELINEFIDFYNEESSVFADGTSFYDEADKIVMTNLNKGDAVSGYITNIISKEVIRTATTLKANVKNADGVKFVLKNGDVSEEIAAARSGDSDAYTAEVTTDILHALGKTDIGTIELVATADGKDITLVKLQYISFGKEKDALPANVLENFELYYGDDGYLGGTFSENSAAGCSSVFTLDDENKANGSYGGKFTYTLKNTTSEVWTGRIKGTLSNHDFSGYNAIQMWIKPDKVEKKMVVQLTDASGEEFEVYLSDFTSNSDKAQYVTIPFSSFKGKQGGTLDTSNIQKFAVWCNSVGNNTNITSSIYFDDIRTVNITSSDLGKKDENGLIITDDAIGTTTPSGSGSGSTSSGGGTVSIPSNPDSSTAKPGDTKPGASQSVVDQETVVNSSGKKVEVTTTTKTDADGNVTSITEKKVIANVAKNTSATVTIKTDSKGDTTATASIVKTGTRKVSGTKASISSSVVAQVVEAAGSKDVTITQKIVDSQGKTLCTVMVNAGDLSAKNKLVILAYNKKTGEYTLINAKAYTVSENGNVSVTIKDNGTYMLMDQTDANKVTKEILRTIEVKESAKTVSKGKNTKISLSKELNMDNVSKITYTSTKSSVAKVDKNGKITTKKAGTATVKAKVTLKNGKTKTVTMKIKVK